MPTKESEMIKGSSLKFDDGMMYYEHKVEPLYNTFIITQYYLVWEVEDIISTMNSHKTLHSSPSWASYEVSSS